MPGNLTEVAKVLYEYLEVFPRVEGSRMGFLVGHPRMFVEIIGASSELSYTPHSLDRS